MQTKFVNKIILNFISQLTGLLRDISYQCARELTCFFANIVSDNESQFVYMADRYAQAYKCVGFVNSTMTILPVDVLRRYPNVEVFYASNLGLMQIHRNFFESASKLVDLHLAGNNFTELENFLFYGTINLRRVLLSDNNINEIGPDTFKKMILKQMNPYDLNYQKKLEEIDLTNNRLININLLTFSQLSTLKILKLKGNRIKLRFGIFPIYLKMLDISYNNLNDFSLKSLINCQLLEDLKLNGNVFSNTSMEYIFPENIFQMMNTYRFELSDCFECPHLADVLIYFKKYPTRNLIVQYDMEALNAPNIFGIACSESNEN